VILSTVVARYFARRVVGSEYETCLAQCKSMSLRRRLFHRHMLIRFISPCELWIVDTKVDASVLRQATIFARRHAADWRRYPTRIVKSGRATSAAEASDLTIV